MMLNTSSRKRSFSCSVPYPIVGYDPEPVLHLSNC